MSVQVKTGLGQGRQGWVVVGSGLVVMGRGLVGAECGAECDTKWC